MFQRERKLFLEFHPFILMKYLREEIYDFELINSELDEYGCQLLGWHPRDN